MLNGKVNILTRPSNSPLPTSWCNLSTLCPKHCRLGKGKSLNQRLRSFFALRSKIMDSSILVSKILRRIEESVILDRYRQEIENDSPQKTSRISKITANLFLPQYQSKCNMKRHTIYLDIRTQYICNKSNSLRHKSTHSNHACT